MELESALMQLSAGRKAPRLYRMFPAIEQKLAEGVTHAEILALLNANGFELTERTYKSYLYRFRKRRRSSAPAANPVPFSAQTTPAGLRATAGSQLSAGTTELDSGLGPKKFEFNAGGLPPELLK